MNAAAALAVVSLAFVSACAAPGAAPAFYPAPSREECARVARLEGRTFTPSEDRGDALQVAALYVDDPNAIYRSAFPLYRGENVTAFAVYTSIILPRNPSPRLVLHERCHARFGAWHE